MTEPLPGHPAGWSELLRTFLRIGVNSFGGPAGQIGVMHKVLVEEKRWIDDRRFTHALNFCMLLPGPEATQLATYVGWLLKGTWGGLAAGLLFILPGAACMLCLSILIVAGGSVGVVSWLLIGLQAAAVALVFEAVVRIGTRVLSTRLSMSLAIAALIASLLHVPFPIIVVVAIAIGLLVPAGVLLSGPETMTETDRVPSASPPHWSRSLRVLVLWLAIWIAPLGVVVLSFGSAHVFSELAIVYSKASLLSFGGAYAAISYVAGEAMHTYHWVDASTIATGLSLAETTPGPLVLVFQFLGYAAGHATSASGGGVINGVISGIIGSAIALWATFAPCFLWIFLGAPYMEALRAQRRLSAALAGVSAAVVGVVANFGLILAMNTLFSQVTTLQWNTWRWSLPVWSSVRWVPLIVAVLALYLLVGRKWGVGKVTLCSIALGAALQVVHWALLSSANWAD